MAADKLHEARQAMRQRGRLRYYLPLMVAAVAIAAVAFYVDWQRQRINEEAARAGVSFKLSLVKARLQSDIGRNVALAQGLANIISEKSHVTQQDWAPLIARIIADAPQMRNIAVAPDFKVSMVYPLAGNEKAIGLDYRQNPAQRTAAMAVVEARHLLITGPIQLVQGGQGLVARFPLISGNPADGGEVWGLISAVIDVDRLFADSGLKDADSGLSIALTAQSRSDGSAHVIFGQGGVMSNAPVTMDVDLGYDRWTLYAAPATGWSNAENLGGFRLMMMAVSLLVLAAVAWTSKLAADRQESMEALQRREDQLAELSHRLELALRTSRIGVWEYNVATGRLHWDRRMRDLYDIPLDQPECSREDWARALHPDDREQAEGVFANSLKNGTQYSTGFRIVRRDCEVHYIRAFGTVYRDLAGQKKIIGVNWDISDDVRLQEDLREAKREAELQNRQLEQARLEMERAALHDPLTGLANRRFLDKVLHDIPEGRNVTVLHLDLDRFKEINDTFGHAAGDVLLTQAADVLRATVYEGDFLARIGGDEFVVLSTAQESRKNYADLSRRLVEAMARPFNYEGHECRVGASIGLAAGNTAHETPDSLLVNADIALYEAKRKGRNRVEPFTDELRLAAVNNKRTADDILRALENDQFTAWYQPQFDAETLEINGFEALVRWNHPTKGVLGPDAFLKIAENLKVVSALDDIVFNQAHAQYMRMIANGIDVPRFSVNISAQRLSDEGFFQRLDSLALKPGVVSVELLESISFEADDGEMLRKIDEIKQRGVDIEIDDFGTGRASILTLLKLSPKRLKIDRELVFPIVTSRTQRMLVRSIIDIGRSRNIEIIAEGVETFEHAEILRDLGCHSLQGYAFARPMPGSQLVDFARQRKWFPRETEGLWRV